MTGGGISSAHPTTYGVAPSPPDGGWGWMVVLGSFVIHVMADGITYSFGLIFDEIVETFNGSRGFAAWIPSILVGLTLGSAFVGPLASAITNRFGCRWTTIIGSCIAASGCAISFFANSVLFLMLSVGGIMGIGCGLMYCPAIVVVTMYFENKRAFATGIAVCGAGLGTFIFSPLTTYLIEAYSWRGTFLIYAGLLLNCAVCGALFRPLEVFYSEPETDQSRDSKKQPITAELPLLPKDQGPLMTKSGSFVANGSSIANAQLGPLSIDTELNRSKTTLLSSSNSLLDLPTPPLKTKSPRGGGGCNPLNLPAILESEDDEQDLAYAMNPHRKTSMHSFTDENHQQNNLFPFRKAITPSTTPPLLGSPTSVPKLLPSLATLAADIVDDQRRLIAAGNNGDEVTIIAEGAAGNAPMDSTGAELNNGSCKQNGDSATAEQFSSFFSSAGVFNSPFTRSLSQRFPSLQFLRSLSPTGIGVRPVAVRSVSMVGARDSTASGSVPPPTMGSAAANIAAQLARRQQMKRQAKAVEARRYRIVTEQADRILRRKDAFYSGSLHNIPLYRSNPDFYRASVTSIPHSVASGNAVAIVPGTTAFISRQVSRRSQSSIGDKEDAVTAIADSAQISDMLDELAQRDKKLTCTERWLDVWHDIGESFHEMTDFSLLADPVYLLYVISNFLTSIGFNIPLVFLPDRAAYYKLDRDKASWVLSAFGIANTFGRVVIGFISDRSFANRILIYNISLTLCGLFTLLSSLFTDYASLLLYAAAFGLTASAYVSLTSVILVDLLGLDRLTSAFGLLLLWQGIASLIGPPVAGWLYDLTGDYDASFYFAGAAICISGLMLFLIPVAQRSRLRVQSNNSRFSGPKTHGCHLSAEGQPLTSNTNNLSSSCIVAGLNAHVQPPPLELIAWTDQCDDNVVSGNINGCVAADGTSSTHSSMVSPYSSPRSLTTSNSLAVV